MTELGDIEIGLCWGTLERASLVELIEAAGRHGFPTLSVSPKLLGEALELGFTPEVLRRRLVDAGVRVRVIDAIAFGLPRSPRPAMSSRVCSLSDEATCFRAAEILGAPIVNVVHHHGKPALHAQTVDALGGISRRAAARGLQIVTEFIPGSGLPTLAAAAELAEAVNAPNFSILLDTWHLARSGGTHQDVRELRTGALGAMQLCDRTELPPGRSCPRLWGRDLPGEGQLRLYELVHAARQNQPSLTFEIEVFSEELRTLEIDEAAASASWATEAWRQALKARTGYGA